MVLLMNKSFRSCVSTAAVAPAQTKPAPFKPALIKIGLVNGLVKLFGKRAMGKLVSNQSNLLSNRLRKTGIAFAVVAMSFSSVAVAQSSDTIITRNVTVQQADTFRSIARREFGKSGLSAMLANFNGMDETATLTPGDIVRIPLFTPVERQFATVIFAKGDVRKNDIRVQRDDKIYLHELLVTGEDGWATLQFASGSVINLQPQTHAKLERLNCLETDDSCLIVLDSAQGEVTSEVNRRDGQPTEFTINTPYASAAVRGTIFEVNALSSKLVVGVTEGLVDLSASNVGVPLDQGFGSIAVPNKPPSDPIALLPAPVYRYIPTRAAEGDRITWWALTDVNEYLINLSTDEAGQEVVANFSESDMALPINNLEPGEYIMNVRGIDSNGLKGFKSPTKIVVAGIDASTDPVDTTVVRQGTEYLVEIIDPPEDAPGYEIQISTSPSFTDPLSVDIADAASALFRLESDKVYTRARVLIDPQLVSAFGGVAESN